MITKNHLLELYVNGRYVELESQESIGLRFNNVIFNPEKMSSTQAEYSFEFDVPSTQNNDITFGYANNYSKLNKFRPRYNAEVYSDGKLIFNGTLTLNSYKDKMYNCNLVHVKQYSLDEIFGDATLDKIPWKIDFNGVTTMNSMNSENFPDATFPLVSYGAFQKDPYESDDVGDSYTSKYRLDKWNKWYIESFAPSLNMLQTIKKAFNWKGYQVAGDAFQDMFLKNLYMSMNLADEQAPVYNLGNPRFGKVDVETSYIISGNGYTQDLQFPYEQVVYSSSDGTGIEDVYNFSQIVLYDLLSSGVTSNQSPSYMYQPNEHLIVIPADGWYQISLSAHTAINRGSLTAAYYTKETITSDPVLEDVVFTKALSSTTPIEIALVRNYSDNYELIKGRDNVIYFNGKPEDTDGNKLTWLTCFPHEDPWASRLPTKKNDLQYDNRTRMGGNRSSSNSSSTSGALSSGRLGGTRSGTIDPSGGGRVYSNMKYGYMYDVGEIMAYDQAVSPSFICGLSSLSNGVAAYMKNGYSWSKSESIKNESFAAVKGYEFAYRPSGATSSITFEDSSVNYNEYINADMTSPICSADSLSMDGHIDCMVYLNKNDVLNLFGITRSYYQADGVSNPYPVAVNAKLTITAYSDRPQNILKAEHANRKDASPEFPTQLNLSNFLNKEKKVSEFIQNVIDAYNLEIVQQGSIVELNKKKKIGENAIYAVDVDNRVCDGETSKINYPKSMAVKYKINTDEHGFYESVPEEHIEDDDWKDYGDSGFTVVELNNDTYVTETDERQLQFSYTWYDDFTWVKPYTGHTEDSGTTSTLTIPVISKEEYMIDGYDYSESMKHDGYGLTQRFWYKPTIATYGNQYLPVYLYTDTYPQEMVYVYRPYNQLNGVNLSYKNTETSLLTKYFNIIPYLSSNYLTVECYINGDEYNSIKNGAMVKFDSDLYYPVEISAFDPTGKNPTELKLLKKI